MIVTCRECTTQFQLDDSKVPARGIRVRCSRCKHAFLVQPPGASPADRIQQAADDALSGDTSPMPGTTQDLPGGSDSGEGGAEADWEFNHDFESGTRPEASRDVSREGSREGPQQDGADRFVAVEEAVDDLLGSSSGDDRAPELADGPVTDLAGSSEHELADGPVTDLAGSSEHELADGPVADLGGDSGSSDLGWDSSSDLADLSISDTPSLAEAELPGSLDAPTPPLGTDVATAEKVVPRIDASIPVPLGSIFSVPTSCEGGDTAAAQAAAACLDVGAASPLAILFRRIASSAGWLVTLALIGAVIHGSLAPRVAEPPTVPSQALAGLQVESVEGRWIENAIAGPIYVVSGSLRATSRSPSASPLEVQVLDERGNVLDVPPAAVGPVLPVRALREQDPAILTEAHGRARAWLARAPLTGGERRRFHAVFTDLPRVAAALRLAEAPIPPPPVETTHEIPESPEAAGSG